MRSIQVFIRWQGWDKKYSSCCKDGIRSTVYIWWQGWDEKYSSAGKDGMRSYHKVTRMGWEVFIWLQGWDDKYVSTRIDWDYSSGGKDGDDKYLSGGMDGMRRIHLVISPVIPVSEVSPPSHKSYLGGTGVIPATVSRCLSSRPPNWKAIPKTFQLP